MNSPITGKEMTLIKENREVEFRKEKFNVVFHVYRCNDSGEQFTDTALDELNMRQVYNQYRVSYNIPFPEEIIGIRHKYGISAAKMSEILSFGINGYRNYEAGDMPSVSNAKLIRMIDNPGNFREMVKLSEGLDESTKTKLIKKAEELIEEKKHLFPVAHLKDYLLGNHMADVYSGYRKPNLARFTEMTVFFAQYVKPYKTKLNKLLFYSDFLNYKLTCYSISGVRYKAIQMGPVPSNFNSVFEFLANKGEIDINYKEFQEGYGEQFVAKKGRPFNRDVFSSTELAVLQTVAKKFKNGTTNKIIDISHSEVGWQKNQKQKGNISYDYAFELKGI